MIVLGSGGHTAEILKLISKMDLNKYSPRIYVVAETDSHSNEKALKQEQELQKEGGLETIIPQIVTIPRSREVGQSYITSVLTTLKSLWFAFWAVLIHRPDVILVNGPGTCIPIVASAVFFRSLGLMKGKIIYIESIARVEKLSLRGYDGQ
eukprot:TRINITY_DN60659_c0_g1_i1.p1 TRINITY_DN60659_c0_g1~~TRINITY_DN60659_c0_g1_i1.p1  ORF type:complete len:151 (-),score=4.05 TRINITY_DN60659_c0_g1_i1:11-463(-)